MSFAMTLKEVCIVDGEELTAEQALTGTSLTKLSRSIDAESTDLELEVSFPVEGDQLVGLYIKSSRDMTLETNDGSTPDNTLSLKANVPLLWHTDSPHACPLTADVASIFATLAAGAASTLEIRALTNATP